MAQEYWRWSEESWINPDLNDWKGACLTAGVDIGSTSTQAVVMADKKPLSYASIRTGSNSKDSAVNAMNRVLELTGLQREEIAFTVGTGYGRVNVPFADKTVTDLLCYRCRRMLRKKIRWFTGNQRYYYCLGECPEHGYVKGKIRMKHTAAGEVYAIKTIKLTDEAGAELIRRRKEETTDRRRVKSRLKHSGNAGRHTGL